MKVLLHVLYRNLWSFKHFFNKERERERKLLDWWRKKRCMWQFTWLCSSFSFNECRWQRLDYTSTVTHFFLSFLLSFFFLFSRYSCLIKGSTARMEIEKYMAHARFYVRLLPYTLTDRPTARSIICPQEVQKEERIWTFSFASVRSHCRTGANRRKSSILLSYYSFIHIPSLNCDMAEV